MATRLKQDDLARMSQKHSEGMSVMKMAKVFNISENTVRRVIRSGFNLGSYQFLCRKDRTGKTPKVAPKVELPQPTPVNINVPVTDIAKKLGDNLQDMGFFDFVAREINKKIWWTVFYALVGYALATTIISAFFLR